jgi:hypothetical protein
MKPIIGFLIDREQIKTMHEDLTNILANEEALSCIIQCDPNPPSFNDPDRIAWQEGSEEPMPQVRKPTDLLGGTIYTLAFANEPEDVLRVAGFMDIGDPDQN